MSNPISFFVTEFSKSSLNRFHSDIKRSIRDKGKISQINLVINTYGGEIPALYGMLDILKLIDVPVMTFNMSDAMSCGAILLAAGTKGMRYMSPGATVMVHNSQFTLGGAIPSQIDTNTMRTLSENHRSCSRTFIGKLDQYCAKPAGYFGQKICEGGNGNIFYDAECSVQEGIVDHIGFPPDYLSIDYTY